MTIYEVNKILSSENKFKIISHFYHCKCLNHDVNEISAKLNSSQPNTSKHFSKLLSLGVLDVHTKGLRRFYCINEKWKAKWASIIEPQINFQRELGELFEHESNLEIRS